jgi:hypothetical protein
MKDFLLDSNGDLEFESESQSDASKFEFNFHIATSDSLLFNFYAEVSGEKKREPGMFQYNFDTYEILYDKVNKLISGDEYIKQAIRISLETEKNTLRENASVGSELYKYRHCPLHNTKIITTIEECIYDAIKHIVPNSEVKVYLKETAYFDFYNAIKISITFLDKVMWFTL